MESVVFGRPMSEWEVCQQPDINLVGSVLFGKLIFYFFFVSLIRNHSVTCISIHMLTLNSMRVTLTFSTHAHYSVQTKERGKKKHNMLFFLLLWP